MSDNPTPFFGCVFEAEDPKGNYFSEDPSQLTHLGEGKKRNAGGGVAAATLAGAGAYGITENVIDRKGLPRSWAAKEMNKGWKKDKYSSTGQRASKVTRKGATRIAKIEAIEARNQAKYDSLVDSKGKALKGQAKARDLVFKKADRLDNSRLKKRSKQLSNASTRVHNKYAGKLKGGAAILGAGITIASYRQSYKQGQKKGRSEFAANEIITDLSSLSSLIKNQY